MVLVSGTSFVHSLPEKSGLRGAGINLPSQGIPRSQDPRGPPSQQVSLASYPLLAS